MRKGLKLGSVIGMGLFLFSLLVSPLPAATPEALDAYEDAVVEVMTANGDFTGEGRGFLDHKKRELGLTDEEARQIEEEVRYTFPLPGVTIDAPDALDDYEAAVLEVMTNDGGISDEDRTLLDHKRVELGLTDEEARQIEEEVRQATKR
jgi:hypothetical protein